MRKSAGFSIAARDFTNVFNARFRENRLLGHAPRAFQTSAKVERASAAMTVIAMNTKPLRHAPVKCRQLSNLIWGDGSLH
jgi:hypothetical protein